MEKININIPIKQIITDHPGVRDIMISLGFSHLAEDAMLNTVGRFITIKEGLKKHKLDLEEVKKVFLNNNFLLEDITWVN